MKAIKVLTESLLTQNSSQPNLDGEKNPVRKKNWMLLAFVKLRMIEREEIGNDLKFKNLNWCHFE